MNCYIVSYDLLKEMDSDGYKKLIKEIKSFGSWAKICESLRAIKTSKKAKDIRDHLRKYMDNNDRLFVIKSGVESARSHVICSSEWLKENL